MSRKLRLLAIIEAYSITGPAKNLLQFASLARDLPDGVETTIATFTRNSPSNLFIETVRQQDLPLVTISEQGLYDRSVITSLRQLVDRLQPDIVQTHAVKSHFLARCAQLHRKSAWVAFHHGYTWPTFRARVYNQLDRWSLRAADKVLTVSIPFRAELTSYGIPAGGIEIIHNAIDPQWGRTDASHSAQLRERFGIPPDRNVILIVGRLSREKDHLTLLEAVHLLPPALKAHLLLVGEGPERPAIEQRVQALNMSASVTFAGQQPSAEPFYGIASVAVLSSLSEGSPNALLEAMAAGVPVVATKVGGIPELVADRESALLVSPGDIAAMSTAIASLLAPDSTLAAFLAANAHRQTEQHHAPAQRVEKLHDIYRSLSKMGRNG